MRKMKFLAVAAAVAAASPAVAQLPNSTHGYPVGQAPSRTRTGQQGVLGDWIHNNQGRVYSPNGQVINNGRVSNNGRVINNGRQCEQRTDRYGRVQTICSDRNNGTWDSPGRVDRERQIEREREARIERERQFEREREARIEREQRIERHREAQFDRQRDHRADQERKWEDKHGRGHGGGDHDADDSHRGGHGRR